MSSYEITDVDYKTVSFCVDELENDVCYIVGDVIAESSIPFEARKFSKRAKNNTNNIAVEILNKTQKSCSVTL